MIEEKVQKKNKTTKAHRACTKVSKEQTEAKKYENYIYQENQTTNYKRKLLFQMEAYFCVTFYKNFWLA